MSMRIDDIQRDSSEKVKLTHAIAQISDRAEVEDLVFPSALALVLLERGALSSERVNYIDSVLLKHVDDVHHDVDINEKSEIFAAYWCDFIDVVTIYCESAISNVDDVVNAFSERDELMIQRLASSYVTNNAFKKNSHNSFATVQDLADTALEVALKVHHIRKTTSSQVLNSNYKRTMPLFIAPLDKRAEYHAELADTVHQKSMSRSLFRLRRRLRKLSDSKRFY